MPEPMYTPPAVVKYPPAYTSLSDTANPCTPRAIPEPSDDQLTPPPPPPPLRRPPPPLPSTTVTDRPPARVRERAPRIHVAARHRQRKHLAVHSRTQRRPVGIAEGRVNAHGIDRLGIIHEHDQHRAHF